MMYGLSPMRRAIYFILPLLFGLILTGIVVVDAARTPSPEVGRLDAALPEGHNWVMFDFSNEFLAGREVAGTTVSVVAGENILVGEVGATGQPLLFDLGPVTSVTSVSILWPDGRNQEYGQIPVDARYTLTYPRTAVDSLVQWFEMNGPLYRIGGFVLAGLLLVLFLVRIIVWAESGKRSHGEVFVR
jgi:hypothetical protein